MIFSITKDERDIFTIIEEEASKLGYPDYVVGGFVRDRLLGRKTKDMDIVCVGDGIRLAEAVASRLIPIPRVVFYSRFGTAMFNHWDIEIEFVGARKESYRQDSRNPEVEIGSFEDGDGILTLWVGEPVIIRGNSG